MSKVIFGKILAKKTLLGQNDHVDLEGNPWDY